MNNYITDNVQLDKILQGATDFIMPFDLIVNDECYQCTEILRLLPGKRLVVKAQHNKQLLVIKLFVKSKNGDRELAREKRGYQLAVQADVKVAPLVFATDALEDYCAISYSYLDNSQPFANIKNTPSMHVGALLQLTAKIHNSGIVQNDFHLDNILLVGQDLYLIDLASVTGKDPGKPLNKATSLANLAMLIVQFEPAQQKLLLNHLHKYYQARNWILDIAEKNKVDSYTEKAWEKRKTKYLEKRFRSCTMTAYKKTFSQQYAFRRSALEDFGLEFINEIDALVSNGQILKADSSTTVVKNTYAGKKLVIKRYNHKSFRPFLKRHYRSSMAAVSWRNGNLLELLGIPTPKPIGFIEKRTGLFGIKAYLVCEDSGEKELSAVYSDRSPTEDELAQLQVMFEIFKKYRISHGDLKATSLLINKEGEIRIIDLENMQEHTNQTFFQHDFDKDKQLLSSNFHEFDF